MPTLYSVLQPLSLSQQMIYRRLTTRTPIFSGPLSCALKPSRTIAPTSSPFLVRLVFFSLASWSLLFLPCSRLPTRHKLRGEGSGHLHGHRRQLRLLLVPDIVELPDHHAAISVTGDHPATFSVAVHRQERYRRGALTAGHPLLALLVSRGPVSQVHCRRLVFLHFSE